MSTTTTLRLDLDRVSTLLGLVRLALDEADEQLADGVDDAEERDWLRARRAVLVDLDFRLDRAGSRLS